MGKLYLKKLWDTLEFAVGYIIAFCVFGFVFQWFFLSRLPLQKLVPKEILIDCLALFSLVVMLVYVYQQRRDNKQRRQTYMKQIPYPPPSFRKEFWQILKSQENMAHTLAFLTLDFLFSIPGGISASPNVLVFILGTLTKLTIEGTAFILLNTFLWCLAHRRWLHYWQNSAV